MIQVRPQIESKLWRIQNLYKIRTKERGVIPFRPNAIQRQILRDVAGQTPIQHFTLKARQVGASTLWLIYWLDDTIFNPGTITGILAHKWESLAALWKIIAIAFRSLPPGLQPKLGDDSKTKLSFKDRASEIFISLSIRSTAVHNLHISEWCLCDNVAVWASMGAVSKWTNVTGESTGNGIGNDGYITYMDGQADKNGFRTRFVPWYAHREYRLPLNGLAPFNPDAAEIRLKLDQEQIHFRRQTKSKLKALFPTEFPESEDDAFSQSGISYFDNRKVAALAREARTVPVLTAPRDADLVTIWEEPQPGHLYAMGADTAEGVDADFSCFKILCVTCRQEAMVYHGHVGIDRFFRDINTWGRRYNECLVGVERNNHGHAVLLGLEKICHYPAIWAEKDPDTRIVVDLSKPRKEPKLGWHTTALTKPPLLDGLKLAIEGDSEEDEEHFRPEFRVHDLIMLSECLTFRQEGSKLSAASGYHDDAIVASAIALQMYLDVKRGRTRLTDLSRIALGDQRETAVPGEQSAVD